MRLLIASLACSLALIQGAQAKDPAPSTSPGKEILVLSFSGTKPTCPDLDQAIPFPVSGGRGRIHVQLRCDGGLEDVDMALELTPSGTSRWNLSYSANEAPLTVAEGKAAVVVLAGWKLSVAARTDVVRP